MVAKAAMEGLELVLTIPYRQCQPSDTSRIDRERDFDLRSITSSKTKAGELELAELVVILGQRMFAIEDLDQDNGLVNSSSRETIKLSVRLNPKT